MANDFFLINGGNPLNGTIRISGAKNAALPLLAASLLSDEEILLKNLPNLTDIDHFKSILTAIGVNLYQNSDGQIIKADHFSSSLIDHPEVKAMRASILLLGPLLTRLDQVSLALPGGCNIGKRPIDEHITAFSQMGVDIRQSNNLVHARLKAKKLQGAKIQFKMPTVTGTENIMMAATLAEGITVIDNAAKEPEIIDLAKLLNAMGAKIQGAGTEIIQIEGVQKLHGTSHMIIPDRIETGTYLIAALATKGSLELTKTNPNFLQTEINHFKQMGAKIITTPSTIQVLPNHDRLTAIDLTTKAYPGFATDLQAPAMVIHALALGKSHITESIFDNRLHHVKALQKMGADLSLSGRQVIVKGKKQLHGAEISATDLRASACLIIAALAAKGQSKISNIHYADRGYSQFDQKLCSLGADITRKLETPLPKSENFAKNKTYA